MRTRESPCVVKGAAWRGAAVKSDRSHRRQQSGADKREVAVRNVCVCGHLVKQSGKMRLSSHHPSMSRVTDGVPFHRHRTSQRSPERPRDRPTREIVSSMAIPPSLGRLEIVPARDVWPHEALDFTPWLLANVDVLSDLLGMDLVLERAEYPVGDFSLDLIGYDQSTNDVVIVENQLEVSDHTHLGQILTYAAGTGPTTIVWIATGFRPEHRAAIDWLNERTDDHTRFFGVQIEVVRIGASEPAPAFRLVAQPNDWEKTVRKTTAAAGEVSTRAATYREASANTTRFEALRARRSDFEDALGTAPIWDDMPGRKACRIVVISEQFKDVADEDQWPAMIDWLIEYQLRFRSALEAVSAVPSL